VSRVMREVVTAINVFMTGCLLETPIGSGCPRPEHLNIDLFKSLTAVCVNDLLRGMALAP
jgi:hypothetical protein